jgi:hypothetical protein
MTDSTKTRIRMRLVALRDGWTCHYCSIRLIPTGEESSICKWVEAYDAGAWWLDPDRSSCSCGEHAPGERCTRPGSWAAPDGYAWPTIDHKIPRARGGGDSLANLVLACMNCNCRKGPRSYEFFVASSR